MPAITLKAHFDGKQIVLDEPFELPSNTPLLVTLGSEAPLDAERADWYALSKANLARAYGDDEPDYPISLLRRQGEKR
jgi:hypothetical protein